MNEDEKLKEQQQQEEPEKVEVVDEEPKTQTPEVAEGEAKAEPEVPEVVEENNPPEETEESTKTSPIEGEESEARDEEKPEKVEEAPAEEEPVEAPVEEVPAKDEEGLKREAEFDELKAKLAELEEEKEIRTKVTEFVDFKNNAEQDFDNFCMNLQASVNNEFQKYHLDTTKTLAELSEGERNIAQDIINRAMMLREQKARATAEAVDMQYHSLVFTKAEKVFNKFEMTNEQAEVAAETFVNIVRHTGVQDLGEDLVEKVKLSVAKALMDVPKKEEEEAPQTMVEAVEQAEEIIKKNQEEVEEVIESVMPPSADKEQQVKEVTATPEPPKADLKGYMDGVDSTTSREGVAVFTVDNVLEHLAKLPHRERTTFYKEHYDLIEQAARKESARRSAKKGSM